MALKKIFVNILRLAIKLMEHKTIKKQYQHFMKMTLEKKKEYLNFILQDTDRRKTKSNNNYICTRIT